MRVVELMGPRGLRLRAIVPASRRERARGLRGRPSLDAGQAMLFERCRSVHTVGMRFPVMVIGLDRSMGVRWVRVIPPGRLIRPRRNVRHMLEADEQVDVRPGDRLRVAKARPERRRWEGPATLRPMRR